MSNKQAFDPSFPVFIYYFYTMLGTGDCSLKVEYANGPFEINI